MTSAYQLSGLEALIKSLEGSHLGLPTKNEDLSFLPSLAV